MSTETPVGDLDRDELEDRVRELEAELESLADTVEQLRTRSVDRTTVNHLIHALSQHELEDFRADPIEHRDAVRDVSRRLQAVEEEHREHRQVIKDLRDGQPQGEAEKWARVVQDARNLATNPDNALPDNRVKLYADDIQQATGFTERYCSDLIEEFAGEYDGVEYQPYKPPSPEHNNEPVRKALIVDLDVWGEDVDV